MFGDHPFDIAQDKPSKRVHIAVRTYIPLEDNKT